MWVYETRDGVTQWYALANDLTAEEVKQAVTQAQEESADALEKANSAFDEALTALENANQANSTANNASQVADSAFNKSIKSSSVTYAVGTSGTTAPTSGWQSTVPSVSASQYLWTRTVFTLQDNSTTTSYSVSKQGAKGIKEIKATLEQLVQQAVQVRTALPVKMRQLLPQFVNSFICRLQVPVKQEGHGQTPFRLGRMASITGLGL